MPSSPTLDGSVKGTASASSCVVNLTTTQTNDFIYVAIGCNGGPVVSVTASGLVFNRRKRNANAQFNFETWAAFSTAALTAEPITVNQTTSDFITVCAFGVHGATGFDPNTALPDAIGDGLGGTTTDRTEITTDNPDDFLIGAYRFGHTSAPTSPGTGWTHIETGNFMAVQYKIVSAPQTALDVVLSTGFNGGNDDQNGGIADALTANSAPTGTLGATEGPDVVAIAANIPGAATLAATESPDVVAMIGVDARSGTMAATEAPDHVDFTSGPTDIQALAATEAPDTVAITGAIRSHPYPVVFVTGG